MKDEDQATSDQLLCTLLVEHLLPLSTRLEIALARKHRPHASFRGSEAI